MHELAIAQRLLETATASLPKAADTHVVALHVRLGPLAGVSREELQFGFDLVAEDTPFSHARLEIEDVPVVIYCATCGAEYRLTESNLPLCPVCDAAGVRIVQGNELTLQSLEFPVHEQLGVLDFPVHEQLGVLDVCDDTHAFADSAQ